LRLLQVRVQQGKEPGHLLALFDGGMVIHQVLNCQELIVTDSNRQSGIDFHLLALFDGGMVIHQVGTASNRSNRNS
jgi:hypothetical protein